MTGPDRLAGAARGALLANASVCFASLVGAVALTRGVPVPAFVDLPLWITALGLLNVVTAFATAMLDALSAMPARRVVPLLLLGMTIALAMELSGTALGVPFGRYEYTQYLGWKLFGLVPVVMPLTWFSVIHPSMELAAGLRLPRAAATVAMALILVLADVPMDPAMTAGFACWTWHQPGPWYGMPLSNWLGWLIVGLVVGGLFGPNRPPSSGRARFVPRALFLLQGTFMALLAVVYGRPGAALAWVAGAAVLLLAERLLPRLDGPEDRRAAGLSPGGPSRHHV